MNSFFDSQLCESEEDVCRKCRHSREYRRGIVASFDEPTDEDFECPKGKTVEDFPQEFELNIFQMGMGLAKSMASEARSNNPPVTNEEKERRMQTCRDCEFLKNGRRCTKCGCAIALKARLRTGECPIGKWGRIVEGKETE